MAYRLVENKGDSVAVPQLVIAKLPELEDDWLRVALFVVATGETDPARIAAALRLKSPERAQTACLLERRRPFGELRRTAGPQRH